jgi:paraquat-inducible protein B
MFNLHPFTQIPIAPRRCRSPFENPLPIVRITEQTQKLREAKIEACFRAKWKIDSVVADLQKRESDCEAEEARLTKSPPPQIDDDVLVTLKNEQSKLKQDIINEKAVFERVAKSRPKKDQRIEKLQSEETELRKQQSQLNQELEALSPRMELRKEVEAAIQERDRKTAQYFEVGKLILEHVRANRTAASCYKSIKL